MPYSLMACAAVKLPPLSKWRRILSHCVTVHHLSFFQKLKGKVALVIVNRGVVCIGFAMRAL